MRKQRKSGLFLLVVFLLASAGTSLIHAEDPSQLAFPAVRYWNGGVQTGPSGTGAVQVPKRDQPKIIILMYHNLVFGRTGNEYNRDIYNFEQDLKFLTRRFTMIGFDDLVAIRDGRLKLTSDAALLTFDDGDLSMYGLAFPLLKEFGVKAAFFIVSDFVGKVGYMNWDQIQEIARYKSGADRVLFTIGSHSASHPHLATVDAETVTRELQLSKTAIESRIGLNVDYLALPFGSGAGMPEIIKAAGIAGYKAIRTSRVAFATPGNLDLWQLPGISIDNSSSDRVAARIWSLLGY